jgi:hypothetical protein
MRISRMIAVTIAALGCFLALTGTALADTSLSATVGPITIPSVPVSVCVNAPGISQCVATPPATTIKLNVAATLLTPSIGLTRPTITPIPCPSGTSGAAAAVATGSATLAVTGSVTVTLAGLPPLTVPIVPVVGLPGKTLKIYACTGVS